MSSEEILNKETMRFKKMILENLKLHLNRGDFERSPTNLGLVCALAELLQFFAIGPSDQPIDPAVRAWWLNFVGAMAEPYRTDAKR